MARKKEAPQPQKHELIRFDQCTLFNSQHAYSHGYDRALCSCGWRSAPSRNQKALVALFEVHLKRVGELPSLD